MIDRMEDRLQIKNQNLNQQSVCYIFLKVKMIKKQTKENQEIAKIIERDQIISYKKKASNKQQKESDDQIESANSLKSGVFSEDSDVKNSKKNTPLPELYRDKKRIFHKNFVIGQGKQVNNYLEKQVRQHDNLVLKQKNNLLSTENMKLKTKVMTLEKQLAKVSKSVEDDGQKLKQPGLLPKDNKFKGSEALSLKMAIKNLRKQLDQQKKENQKIKWSVKFTRISQLQCERDQILSQTARLRQMLEQQQLRRASLKSKQQGLSTVEQKLQSLTEKNLALVRQNAELQKKVKGVEEGSKKIKQISENEKNLSKMLFNAKRLIREKQKQIQTLKVQSSSTQPKIQSIASINMDPKSSKQVNRPTEVGGRSKEKRIMSKSAQKYRKKASDDPQQNTECQNCPKHKQKIQLLEKKLQELTLKLKAEKQNGKFGNMGQFSRQQIQQPKAEEMEKLGRFLTFRFKAHHLGLQEAQKYLINGQLTQAVKKESISVLEMAQSLVAQPFSILSSRYLETCLLKLFYPQPTDKNQKNTKIKIDQNKKLTKGQILANFTKFIQPYQIMPQQKEEEMFIQIAELVTNYHQHILTALNRKRNGEGTISELELTNFFNQIELEKQFVDFIICQIILESLDLEHLNYYTMFQIFYMPPQGQAMVANEPNQPNKKKFQVDHSQVVKQEDEQYEQSKSHIDTKQKTQSRKDQQMQQYQQEQQQHSPSQHSEKPKAQEEESSDNIQQARQKRNKSLKNVEARLEKQKQRQKQKQKSKPSIPSMPNQPHEQQQDYQQLFEEQKMDQPLEQQKADQQEVEQQELKPYMMQQVYDEYKEQPV